VLSCGARPCVTKVVFMRFVTKMALLVGLLVLMAGFAFHAPPVQAQGSTGVVTFYNNTSTPLTFSVDNQGYTCRVGIQYGSCQIRAAVGGHTLYAKYDNGNVGASETITLTVDGFTWTIHPAKE
jgi:hypothetical protein